METRLHRASGQGMPGASQMLGYAFSVEGKYAAGFPMFGFQRIGVRVPALVHFACRLVKYISLTARK